MAAVLPAEEPAGFIPVTSRIAGEGGSQRSMSFLMMRARSVLEITLQHFCG